MHLFKTNLSIVKYYYFENKKILSHYKLIHYFKFSKLFDVEKII